MPGLFGRDIEDVETAPPGSLEPHQLKAAAAPNLPIRELTKETGASESSGNFKDLESLLEQLGAPPVFELGNPLPQEKFMPKQRIGDCHASHNRFLLDEGD